MSDNKLLCNRNGKVTGYVLSYPKAHEPDYIIPNEYSQYRFAIGKKGTSPLVAICMNPSAARDTESDLTINRIIGVSRTLGFDGWMVFNTYPERATNAKNLNSFDLNLSNENLSIIKRFLVENGIAEVWGAWGDDVNNQTLLNGKIQLISMLKSIGVKIYYFGTLTKKGNPRHPLQRYEKWDFSKKEYLD